MELHFFDVLLNNRGCDPKANSKIKSRRHFVLFEKDVPEKVALVIEYIA